MIAHASTPRPAPVRDTLAHLARIARLSRISREHCYDSTAQIDWSAPAPDTAWMKAEWSLGLYGTRYWDLLDDEQRRRLAFLEVTKLWYSFVEVEQFQVRLQVDLVLKDQTRRIPDEIREYYVHFCKEELVHTLMFIRALRHFGAPTFPDEVGKFRLLAGGLDWIAAAAIVVTFESFAEETEHRTVDDPTVHPVVRQIGTSHHIEEARHITFGQELVAAFWHTLTAEQRDEATRLLVGVVALSLDDLAMHLDVLRAMRLTRPEFADLRAVADEARRSEYRVELNRRMFRDIFAFLRDVDIYNRATAPVFAQARLDHYFAGL